jgi:replicative superfamily II helicase
LKQFIHPGGKKMVDFTKKLVKNTPEKLLAPQLIYEKLDRASDKGPLRPSQIAVLDEWHTNLRNKKDVILKMHTGQGKTLTGLLMLQSKLNEYTEPVIYLCPNKHLVEQTVAQAEQFGVKCVVSTGDLPEEFINGHAILVTHIHKLFNGLTKFGLGPQAQRVSTILIDDAHSCIESIKDAFSIKLDKDHPAYGEILALFDNELNEQGSGSFAEIKFNNNRGALLAVPYWAWYDKKQEVTNTLSKYTNSNNPAHKDPIKFAWPLLKDVLAECLCAISGSELEIFPYSPPLYLFSTYTQARHRVFMSATFTNDAFLIKGLGVSEEAIRNSLTDKNKKWSGEKMILIPSLISPALNDIDMVAMFGKIRQNRSFGVVALTPSFKDSERWQIAHAEEATTNNIYSVIERLKEGDRDKVIVIANRYDGIDLPDSACRILIIDSAPSAQGLIEKYIEERREGSAIFEMTTARTIEQGLGRAVRGDKDYCVVILLGPSLIKKVKSKASQKFFSPQTRKQIEIGLVVASMVSDEAGTKSPIDALIKVLNQCLTRDSGWKDYYEQEMNDLPPENDTTAILKVFSAEALAEKKYQEQNYNDAERITQQTINELIDSEFEKGWYLQEIARYIYPRSKSESQKFQIAAHRKNPFLFKPKEGMSVSQVTTIGQKRAERIIQYAKSFNVYQELSIELNALLYRLILGIDSDVFERSINQLAKFLGFEGQRPDKEFGAGPDNLWALQEGQYLLIECKNEVKDSRPNIYKTETGQMNNSTAWFKTAYHGASAVNLIIHPVNKLANGAAFNESVGVIREVELTKLKDNVRSFYNEFNNLDFNDLSEVKIQQLLNTHHLSIEDISKNYCVAPFY